MAYVLDLQDVEETQVGIVGGKGAQLGELCGIEGVRVPDGFCVTTDGFRRFMARAPSIDEQLAQLTRVVPTDLGSSRELSGRIRARLEAVEIPEDLALAITGSVRRLGEQDAYAVRSSATAEDLPGASFAGQHDSYLNVVGPEAILEHVRRCWASLFTERAVSYRLQAGFDHDTVAMAVVVQRMVPAEVSGVLFTADPVTSNRTVASVEACFGLGEALVSGRANPDVYAVRAGEVISSQIAGGRATLTPAQVTRLVRVGRRIEAHLGRPQDIEWCLAGDAFQIVQSRAITTLFPVPAVTDGENHVYVSVGHQQMMTDAFRPLGISMWQITVPRPMAEAGGRLFVDVTALLASPTGRARLSALGRSDPLTGTALEAIADREGFIRPRPDQTPAGWAAAGGRAAGALAAGAPEPIATDPAIVSELIDRARASIARLEREIESKSGPALLEFILHDTEEMRRVLSEPRSVQAIMAGMEAARWLNENLLEWLGEKGAADTLVQSAPHNVTAEMGVALLDLADVIRPYPAVVARLRGAEDDAFLDELDPLEGGAQARAAIGAYLDRYGMRCVGEIDITRPRWSERPSLLLPVLLANVDNFEPGAGRRRFEQGRRNAAEKEREVLERLRLQPDGEARARETARMIERLRTFSGYREYPKYALIRRYFVYKRALMGEAGRLAQAGVVREPEDTFYLTLQELHDVVRTHRLDGELVARRRAEYASYVPLTPPRVFTSDGEVITGAYGRDDLPAGALVGLPVSAGVVEGRARVIRDISQADLDAGDILVTAYTDPSWTPLFLGIRGLVTEVGGLMTHGAVIAREYGLPAVVGVQDATGLIRDGQWIRLHGTEGYVEIIPEPADRSPRAT